MTLAPGLSPTPFCSGSLTLECTRRMREGLAFPRPCVGKGLIVMASLAWGPSLGGGTPGLKTDPLGGMSLSVPLTLPSW